MPGSILKGKWENGESTESKNAVKILFTGDLCPIGRTEKLIFRGKSNEILSGIYQILSDKDLLVVNLESPLVESGFPIKKSGPNLKLLPVCVEFLKAAGVDVACLANNHIGDYGADAVIDTIEVLKKNGIKTAGAGACLEDARKPLIIELKGKRVAILAYAENEFGIADLNIPGSSPLDPIDNIKQIRKVSTEAEIIIVVIHGGNEYNPMPSPRAVKTYRAFAENGASLVVAMHTHCPQGIEIYNGTPIIYSLGNFLFDWPMPGMAPPDENFWWKGYMASISFEGEKASRVEAIPCTFGPDASCVKALEYAEKEGFLVYLDYLSKLIADEKELNLLWYGWCALKGPQWLKDLEGAGYPPERMDEESLMKCLDARNAFTCESHNELTSTYLRMICENKVGMGVEQIQRIERLQKGMTI
jgi:Putative enzyme of poly-gamma-glutamate biosynthesis (capsule formation)